MSVGHLIKGDACPPLQKGVLRLYSMKYSPYAQRTRLVLAAKKIEHEEVNVSTVNKPEWLFEKNVLGKVPILEQDDKLITESLVISDYLDSQYSHNPLHPKDPEKRARDRGLVSVFEAKVTMRLIRMVFNKADPKETFKKMLVGLDTFENELKRRDQKYFGGEQPGMLDYMIWPMSERLGMIGLITKDIIKIPSSEQHRLLKWIEDMREHPSVSQSYATPEKHFRFFFGKKI